MPSSYLLVNVLLYALTNLNSWESVDVSAANLQASWNACGDFPHATGAAFRNTRVVDYVNSEPLSVRAEIRRPWKFAVP